MFVWRKRAVSLGGKMGSLGEMEGFGVSGKAAKEGSEAVDESLTWRMMMERGMAPQVHHSRPLLPPHQMVCADGPTSNNKSRPKTSISIPSPGAGGEDGEFLLQPFQFDISSTTAYTRPAFKSPGTEGMSLEFPFTSAQWKELERQAMIYKYMMSSVPVPPHLLIPITRSPSAPAASHSLLGNGLNLRLSGTGGDAEPGRCRRTDGKKWRCSRDVAPDQKYCERHMHRGRPRSRKHVEQLPTKKSRHSNPTEAPASSPSTIDFTRDIAAGSQFASNLAQPLYQNQASGFPDTASEKAAIFGSVIAASSSHKEPRGLEWMMNGERIPLNDEPLSLNSLAGFSSGEDQQANSWPLFFDSVKPQLNSSDRGFIDAWSECPASDETSPDFCCNRNSVSSNGKLCLSPLSLTVGGKDAIDDEIGGVGVSDPDHGHLYGSKSNPSSWLAPASWATSSPGGPLAEVLRPRKVAAAATGATSDPASPVAADGTSCSPTVMAGSSPSGVLQRALASLSDSSGNNSPTPGSSGAKYDVGLFWLSHGKLASSS